MSKETAEMIAEYKRIKKHSEESEKNNKSTENETKVRESINYYINNGNKPNEVIIDSRCPYTLGQNVIMGLSY